MSDDRDHHDNRGKHNDDYNDHHKPEVALKPVENYVEEGGILKYKAVVDHAVDYDIRVKYNVYDGTAHKGEDYYPQDDYYVVIKAGDYESEEIKIKTIDDYKVEDKYENLYVKLEKNDYSRYDIDHDHDKEKGVIKDNDEYPNVYLKPDNDYVKEGDYGFNYLHFTVHLDKKAGEYGQDVYYHTEDGTAKTYDNDYVGVRYGVAHVDAYKDYADIYIKVVGDYKVENDEYMKVKIDENDYYNVKDGESKGWIQNDDYRPNHDDHDHHDDNNHHNDYSW